MELLKDAKGEYIAFDVLWNQIKEEHDVVESFARQTMRMFVSRSIAEESGSHMKPKYKWLYPDQEVIDKAFKESYGDNRKIPNKLKEYREAYGFDSLVDDVSKWIDHDGRTVKEYDTDRLWLGRYVDFLDKARQYLKWYEADQGIARKKIADAKSKALKT